MNYLRKTLLLMILMIIFSQITLAIKISPPINAGMLEPKTSYEFLISLTNQENKTIELFLDLTSRAEYLSLYSTFESSINLAPYKTKNILITIHTQEPGIFNPGNHILTILPETTSSGNGVGIISSPVIEIKFTIPGNVTKKLELNNFNVVQGENNIDLQLSAENTGNVRVGAFPIVEIQKYHGTNSYPLNPPVEIKGKTQYLIYPEDLISMNLVCDISSLNAGKYKAIAKVEYDNKETNIISHDFTIEKEEKSDEDKKEPNSNPSSENNYDEPYNQETGTINIGGNLLDETQNQPEIERKELRISNLKIEPIEGENGLIIRIEIENIYKDNINYEAIFSLFDELGNKVDEMTEVGEVNGFEIKNL